MKLVINKDRSVIPVGTWGTVNENNYEILDFEFPAELEEYNKRIVYYLGDERVWDTIVNNKAYITNAITTKGDVKAYVWCTKENTEREADTDFRTMLFEMHFYENENADGIVPTEEQVDGFNTMLTAMNNKIDEVDALEQTIETAEAERQEAEATRVSNESTRESNESTRQTNEQTRQTQEADRERRTDEAIADIEDKTAEYNANAEAKTNEFNQNATQKTNQFNNNYTQKVNDFNTNATTQKTDFNSNASSKTSAFNSNAETKTNAFNTNATNKTNAFNSNATEKTTTFNNNASTKTSEFNTNAESKTSAFNDNATQKTTNFDNNASEKTDEFNTNAKNKIDEYDEHIVEYQAQIDELQEEVDELSDNMPWNTTEQATEISVDDAAKYSKNKLELFGNTEQIQYTGKNLLPYPYVKSSETINGITFTDLGNGSIMINGTATKNAYFNLFGTSDVSQQQIIPGDYVYCENGNSNIGLRVMHTQQVGQGNQYITLGISRGMSAKINLSTYTTGYVEVMVSAGATVNNLVIRPMITMNEDNDYEPYVGGVPSPNPDYPQDIHVVTGNNTIHVLKPGEFVLPTGYTQLEYIKSTGTQWIDTEYKPNNNTKMEVITLSPKLGCDSGWYNKSFDVAEGPFSYGDTGGNFTMNNIKELIVMQNGNIKTSLSNRNFPLQNFQCEYNMVIFAINRNGEIVGKSNRCEIYSLKLWENDELVRDFVPCINPDNQIGLYDMVSKTFFANQGTGNFVAGNEIHHADYPINLGLLELCKIGDYQDYLYKENSNWYVHKEIEKVVLNGSENWNKSSAYTNEKYFCAYYGPENIISNTDVLCDKLKYGKYNANPRPDYESIAGISYTLNIQILLSKLSGSTITALKTWLSTNNLSVYYQLATPTTTQITDETLIAQLDELYEHLRLVKGTNIATITASDLAPNMQLSYMQDLKSKLDNLDSRLSLLE